MNTAKQRASVNTVDAPSAHAGVRNAPVLRTARGLGQVVRR